MNEFALSPTERLFEAIIDGSISGVESACEDGANVNAVNSRNETPLYIACKEGFAHIVEYLLDCPDIDITKGGYDYDRQIVGGIVYTPEDVPKYHVTPLSAAVSDGNHRIVNMLLNHERCHEYLQPNEDWETAIARTFNPDGLSPCLATLIDYAKMTDRKLLNFTIQKVVDYGVDWYPMWYYEDNNPLSELLKQLPREIQALASGYFASNIIRFVKEEEEGELETYLEKSQYFCSSESLQPYLLSALHLARQKRYIDCEEILCKALKGNE